jgi:hypothetical protein
MILGIILGRTHMKMLLHVLAATAIGAAFGPSLSAQWPRYPTAGVSRTPDGQPNLSARAPRAPDGKPDLSGNWQYIRQAPRVDVGVGGAGGTPLPDGSIPNILSQFWDIGFGMKDPLPFQPWAAELRKSRMADNQQDNPDAHCLPIGFMQLHTHPDPRKIVQTPGLIVIMWEANYGLRQIFLDGRSLPGSDAQPWWYGYSIGKWDGDTLVVETSGLRDGGWLDVLGSPFTDAAKVTERFRRVNQGNLEIDVTVDDPKAYTRPWSVTIKQRLMLDSELMEFICAENEKDAQHFVK